MKRWHSWESEETPCVKCGQDFWSERHTTLCVCWKMRLPKRKETNK